MSALRGRPVFPGAAEGRAVVCPTPFNTLAQLYDAVVRGAADARLGDPATPTLVGVDLAGRVLCVPALVGSTSAGAIWEDLARRGLAPAAVLVAGPIDPLTAAGLAIAAEWTACPIACVDGLGDDLLVRVPQDGRVSVGADGVVRLGG